MKKLALLALIFGLGPVHAEPFDTLAMEFLMSRGSPTLLNYDDYAGDEMPTVQDLVEFSERAQKDGVKKLNDMSGKEVLAWFKEHIRNLDEALSNDYALAKDVLKEMEKLGPWKVYLLPETEDPWCGGRQFILIPKNNKHAIFMTFLSCG